MKNENLIHVKLEYGEALQSKRNVLSSEMNLLRITKSTKRYKLLRSEELKLKISLLKKIKDFLMGIKKLQITLPKLEIPEILKDEKNFEKIKSKIEVEEYDENLESQLKDIQEKLNSLQE
ncbi:hypothetical protein KAR52_00040 [Candidatus Pacearchaeota archaeon]|nr:hypothetical protein [Candidatus Pacearchaeota archaeon]MCK5150037.1 hypothetical protein [Candidatus Pacearchaeota archaeon]